MPYGHDKLKVTEHILWEDKPPLKQFAPIICTSLLFEAVQFIFAIGASDITDIITNSLGGIIGVMASISLSKLSGKHWIRLINIISTIGSILLTLLIAVLLLANL
ncbi:MAG: hypothetical protein HFG65_14670 [Hungatella sp.]|nr:hypothetical protein [Hungatella sp.]